MNQSNLKNLPEKHGCYLFSNKNGQVIYVGKANNLRNRVRSYFAPGADLTPAKQQMVKQVSNIKTIIVANELEALLLEVNLIKKYRPKYNVVMKDDKNFCYLKVTYSPQLAAKVVRQLEPDKNAKYYGPYLSAAPLRQLLKLVKYFSTPKQKQQTIISITKFLQGKSKPIVNELENKMKIAAADKNFELAVIIRDRLQAVQKIIDKQTVISKTNKNQDIVSLFSWQDKNIINLFRIRQGKLIDKINLNIKSNSSNPTDIFTSFVAQYYKDIPSPPQDIILPIPINISALALKKLTGKKIKIIIPKKGRYKKLIKLGELNAQNYLPTLIPSFAEKNKKIIQAVNGLKKTLKINNDLKRIECYDISNIQGQFAVGAMVVFTDGQPDKSQYRKFKIKYTTGINDVAMMSEIVARRFANHPDWPKPSLIIIDGGQGQLTAVLNTLRQLHVNLATVALAKREEGIFLPNRKQPIKLPKKSEELFLIQRIRDEAHRFAITYYRQRHKKNVPRSILDTIPGLGPKNKRKLLLHFKSITAIKKAKISEMSGITGKKLANNIKKILNT